MSQTHTFESVLQEHSSNVWYFHFIVPEDVVAYYREHNKKRLLCSVEEKVTFHCGLMPQGNYHFINVNKEIRKKLNWNVGETRLISLSADESQYGMDVCAEFLEVLDSDERFHHLFHTLTPGKQRNLIYIASKPKTSPTRIKKSLIIADYLKDSGGELDFKALNQAFKTKKDDYKL